jgi:hypothetical protein
MIKFQKGKSRRSKIHIKLMRHTIIILANNVNRFLRDKHEFHEVKNQDDSTTEEFI